MAAIVYEIPAAIKKKQMIITVFSYNCNRRVTFSFETFSVRRKKNIYFNGPQTCSRQTEIIDRSYLQYILPEPVVAKRSRSPSRYIITAAAGSSEIVIVCARDSIAVDPHWFRKSLGPRSTAVEPNSVSRFNRFCTRHVILCDRLDTAVVHREARGPWQWWSRAFRRLRQNIVSVYRENDNIIYHVVLPSSG